MELWLSFHNLHYRFHVFWQFSCFCHEAYFSLWGVERASAFSRGSLCCTAGGRCFLLSRAFPSWAVSTVSAVASGWVPGSLCSSYFASKNMMCLKCLEGRQSASLTCSAEGVWVSESSSGGLRVFHVNPANLYPWEKTLRASLCSQWEHVSWTF